MPRHEARDVNSTWILIGGASLVLALAVVLVAVSSFEAAVTGLPVMIGRPVDLAERLSPAPTPPAPRLEPIPGEQLASYRSAALERLNSYGWVDRTAGRVHIPIDQAMDLIAQRGHP